jgi:signal transduction histidine kinase
VLENARRYSGGRAVSVRARAVRSLASPVGRAAPRDVGEQNAGERRAAGDRVIVRVVDRGPGIPVAQLERIFEPFYRSAGGAGGHRGSGLGLAIARGFAEANAGSLHVESLPGQGATFVFELPIPEPGGGGPDGEPPLAAHAQDGARQPLPARGGRGRES